MKVRKLEQAEHGRTRALWEDIFVEDSKAFLDYYYQIKTADNVIYAVEDKSEIRAMLQLNPYQLRIEESIINSHYIIAVATDEKYRHQGLMASLLKRAMQDMYGQEEPFTFLMPASPAIYEPFDFRYIYWQNQSDVRGCNEEPNRSVTFVHAEDKDCKALAKFANQFLQERYQVFAVRDEHYYEVLLKEQESEHGGIVMLKEGIELVGIFLYAKGETLEIREPLILPGYETDFRRAVLSLTGDASVKVHCLAYGSDEKKPMIMARALHLKTLLECMKVTGEMKCCFGVTDPIIDENNRTFCLASEQRKIHVETKETNEEVNIPISKLTEFLFGVISLAEMERDMGITFPDKMKEEFAKIIPLSAVCLNEIV